MMERLRAKLKQMPSKVLSRKQHHPVRDGTENISFQNLLKIKDLLDYGFAMANSSHPDYFNVFELSGLLPPMPDLDISWRDRALLSVRDIDILNNSLLVPEKKRDGSPLIDRKSGEPKTRLRSWGYPDFMKLLIDLDLDLAAFDMDQTIVYTLKFWTVAFYESVKDFMNAKGIECRNDFSIEEAKSIYLELIHGSFLETVPLLLRKAAVHPELILRDLEDESIEYYHKFIDNLSQRLSSPEEWRDLKRFIDPKAHGRAVRKIFGAYALMGSVDAIGMDYMINTNSVRTMTEVFLREAAYDSFLSSDQAITRTDYFFTHRGTGTVYSRNDSEFQNLLIDQMRKLAIQTSYIRPGNVSKKNVICDGTHLGCSELPGFSDLTQEKFELLRCEAIDALFTVTTLNKGDPRYYNAVLRPYKDKKVIVFEDNPHAASWAAASEKTLVVICRNSIELKEKWQDAKRDNPKLIVVDNWKQLKVPSEVERIRKKISLL